VRQWSVKYVAEGSKYAHWIGLYLSVHLNLVNSVMKLCYFECEVLTNNILDHKHLETERGFVKS